MSSTKGCCTCGSNVACECCEFGCQKQLKTQETAQIKRIVGLRRILVVALEAGKTHLWVPSHTFSR